VEVGVFEGRNRFSELVEAAERGEETIVMKRGRPVAKLVPIVSEADAIARRRAALERADALRAQLVRETGRVFTHEEIISARDEGRR
jgi:prevent-host-death family protein